MSKNILSKITSTIRNLIYNSSGSAKEKAMTSFKLVLDQIGVLTELRKELLEEFEKSLSTSREINEDYISSLILLVLGNCLEKCYLFSNAPIGNKIMVVGAPGCGKTTFISGYIYTFGIKSAKVVASKSSTELLDKYATECVLSNTGEIVFVEINDLEEAEKYASDSEMKVVYCVDINQDPTVLVQEHNKLKMRGVCIDYLVITKRDNMVTCRNILNLPYISGKKILYFTCGEIKAKKPLANGNEAMSIIMKEALGKDIDDFQELRTIIQNQINQLDMNGYKSYLEFVCSSDMDKMNSVFDAMSSMKDYIDLNKVMPGAGQYMEQMKNKSVRDNLVKNMKSRLVIINSMRRNERANPAIIDGARIERIAKGAGVAAVDVIRLKEEFYSYKNIMGKVKDNLPVGQFAKPQ